MKLLFVVCQCYTFHLIVLHCLEHIAALASTPSRPSPRGRQPSLDVITPTWADLPQHPRLAVVLGIAPRYRHPLLACRSLCFCPSIWGTLKCIVAVWRVFDRRRDNAEFGCVAAELCVVCPRTSRSYLSIA
ncbi:hypothetical protein EV426DRAFT_271068 [Tirmania nivea]|nr:hypothetical protein EV426DRAFT_271068 [Tirmania nivea]